MERKQEPTALRAWSVITLLLTLIMLGIIFYNTCNVMKYSWNTRMILSGSIFLTALLITVFIIYVIRYDREKIKELNQTESTDFLTKISNKNSFYQELIKIFIQNRNDRYVIIVLDIHEFKLINHNYSYRQGDRLLCSIADALTRIAGEKGRAARLGSDCFSVLLEQEELETQNLIDILSEDIRSKMGEEIASAVRLTMGYYIIQDRQEDVRNMIDKAIIAWKYAKRKEMKCKAYDEVILKKQIKAKQIQDSQVAALKNGELKVYLQPKIDLHKNCICGAEALVRWDSEEMGFMPPDEFIPVLEKNGFVKEVDFYVLEQICKYISQRGKLSEKAITLSVNQSRATILDIHYLKRIKEMLEKYQVPAKFLDLEVTESLFIGDYKIITDKLTQIRKMGISISMDDFGSGYSSLNLLKKMSIDNLKIDKEFLDESETSEQTRIIIKTVIDMAKQLNIRVICEGVETQEQVQFLKEIACDEAQGFYYGKPIPMEEFCQKCKDESYDDLLSQKQ